MKKNQSERVGTKEPVKIRFKNLADGRQSIYLAYWQNGKWKYEFLKQHLIPEHTKQDAKENKETLSFANAVKAKRIVELRNDEHGFKNKAVSGANLLYFIDGIAEKHLERTNNKHGEYYNFKSLNVHLELYKGDKIRFKDIDKSFTDGFIAYLRTAKNQSLRKNKNAYLSSNTQNKLFKKLNTALKQAVKNKLIPENPLEYIDKNDKPKTEDSTREYLTIDELKKLINTYCANQHVKNSFLFCCLTGLRFSDVSRIVWKNFKKNNSGGDTLCFKIKKSNKDVTIQISSEAMKWVVRPTDAKPDDRVFALSKNEAVNPIVAKWVADAGITKHITYHCSRHTAATLNLSIGTPIAVVSKLLGHSKIATTQIYAKIVDEAQRDAVDKQNGLFG